MFIAACQELWKLLDDRHKASAGTSSVASAVGNPHFNDHTHDSAYDRNLLLYAMLEIQMSMDHDSLAEVEYGTLTLLDTICGSGVGGYRVPTQKKDWNTYEFNDGYDVDSFAPVVMYGSLETVRSAFLASATECREGFAAEDVALSIYCNGIDGGDRAHVRGSTHLRVDAKQREWHAPFAMQRDRYCDESVKISVEDALARPPSFDSDLYDTEYKRKAAIDQLIVPSWHRGEEGIDSRRRELSLRAFVYITSSSDGAVRPGMHRLLDLPVFGSAECKSLPGVDCAGDGPYSVVLSPGDAALVAYERDAAHRSGRQMLKAVRCSALIQGTAELTAPSSRACTTAPFYGAHQGCHSRDLVLSSRPVLYASKYWIRTLTAPPPSPPPTSPSPPPPSPLPPLPQSPPLPPYVQPQGELMQYIRTLEEATCTSVYYLTSATRCDRLAVGLSQSVLYAVTSPPRPPPAQPSAASPPPPHPPPSPALPSGFAYTPVDWAQLSTTRVPTPLMGELHDPSLHDSGYYAEARDILTMRDALKDVDVRRAARCTKWQSRAPMPCATAALATNCIPGLRHCGTSYQISHQPFLELGLSGTPASRGRRLWGLEIFLPQNPKIANLFYHSVEPEVGDSGYTIQVYRSDGSTIACAPQAAQHNAAELTSDRKLLHVCAGGGASDADLYALADAYRIRVTLLGRYRQLWLANVNVVEASLTSAELDTQPPRPPPLPGLPPTPPARPAAGCTFAARQFYASVRVLANDVGTEEPCGKSADDCCRIARGQHEGGAVSPDTGARAFALSDSGCCTVIVGHGPLAETDAPWGFLTAAAGTGIVPLW